MLNPTHLACRDGTCKLSPVRGRTLILVCTALVGCSGAHARDAGWTDAGADGGLDGGGLDGGADAGHDAAVGDAGELGDAASADAGSLTCSPEAPCVVGVCAGGPSCGDPWSCVAAAVDCLDDSFEYCGCDGASFFDSSTCPTRPFAHPGACAGPAGFSCDRRGVSCRAVEPICPAGQVAEVDAGGTCWTFRCVPLTDCACADSAECPGDSSCDGATARCG